MANYNNKTANIMIYVSNTTKMRIKLAAEKQSMPMSRVAALALDAAMDVNPGFNFDLELPDEYVEYAFANEAGRILDYIKKEMKGKFSSLYAYSMRHDIGVTDKEVFLGAFKELIEKGFIVPVESSDRYPKDYQQYSLPRTAKESREDREYTKYMKLKEKFEKNKETK